MRTIVTATEGDSDSPGSSIRTQFCVQLTGACLVVFAELLHPFFALSQPLGDVFSSQGEYDRFAVGGAHRWYDNHTDEFKQKSSHCLPILDEAKTYQDKALELYDEAKQPGNSRRQTELVKQGNEQIKLRGERLRAFTDCVNQANRRPMLQGKVEQNEGPPSQQPDEDKKAPPQKPRTKTPPPKKVPPPSDPGPDAPIPLPTPQPAGPSAPPTEKNNPTPKPPSQSPTYPDKKKTLSGGTQKDDHPNEDDDGGGPKNKKPIDGGVENGGPGTNDLPPGKTPPQPPVLQGGIKKICNLRELAALVDERYKTGNPIGVYRITNRGPNTYLVLLAGTELMEIFQANNTIEAVKAYIEGIIPNPDTPYMREILRVLTALPVESKLVIAGHSQGGMQGLNSLNFFNRNPHTAGFFVDHVITFGSPISQINQLNPNTIIAGQNVPRFTFVEVNGDPIPQASLVNHQALKVTGVGIASWISNHLHYKNSVEIEHFDVFGIPGGKACLYLDIESFKSYEAQAFPFQTPQKSTEPPRGPPCNPKPTVQPTVRFEHDWYTATWGSDRTAKDFARFQPSGDGVVVTDIFRDRQPKGCAGVMLADALRGAGIKKPKWIRIADIIKEQPTLAQLKAGVPVPETVLGRVAVEAARELGGTVVSSDHGIYKKYSFDDGKPWIEVKLSYP